MNEFFRSGHAGWPDFERQYNLLRLAARAEQSVRTRARLARRYIRWKTQRPLVKDERRRHDEVPPFGTEILDERVIAAINAMSLDILVATLRDLNSWPTQRLNIVMAGIEERGEQVLSEHPDLWEPEPGPPRGLVLACDQPPPKTEAPQPAAPEPQVTTR